MTVTSEAAAADAGAANDAGATGGDAGAQATSEGADAGADAGGEGGETATPDEIREVLGRSGMKTDSIVDAPAAAEGEEEEEVVPGADEAAAQAAAAAGEAEEEVVPPVKPDKPADAAATGEEREFTIEVEDANGNKHKISNIEDLPEDFEPKSNRQGLEILRDLQKLDAEREKYEADQAIQSAEAEKTERVTKIQEGWNNEFKELGISTDADKQKVYDYMAEENTRREKQGMPMLATIQDAKNGLAAKEAAAAAAAAKVAEKEDTRKKGALVGGSSAPASSNAPVYRGGARNADQAIKQMDLVNKL
jgi:hypothetical protein